MNVKSLVILIAGFTITLSINAVRLRFILENNTNANLFACLRTQDCNPLNEAEMRPGERENIYTENFRRGITRFIFKLEIHNEFTQYDVVYNSQTKTLQLQREGIVFDEMPYNAEYAEFPPYIRIDPKLDAHFDPDAIYETQRVTGRNVANSAGYKPSLYLGDGGQIPLRRDKNHFCRKHTPCRDDLSTLSYYVGICDHPAPHDNLNPFCHKKHINWSSKRFENCPKRCD